MPRNSEDQIALLVRDEKTGRYAFNSNALEGSRHRSTEGRERVTTKHQ